MEFPFWKCILLYTLLYKLLSYDKNNFHKKLQSCKGGTILKQSFLTNLFSLYKTIKWFSSPNKRWMIYKVILQLLPLHRRISKNISEKKIIMILVNWLCLKTAAATKMWCFIFYSFPYYFPLTFTEKDKNKPLSVSTIILSVSFFL